MARALPQAFTSRAFGAEAPIRDGAVSILNRARFELQSFKSASAAMNPEAGPLVCTQYPFKNCHRFIALTVVKIPTADTVQNAMRAVRLVVLTYAPVTI